MNLTFIANFGKENFAWAECLSTSIIAVSDDEGVHHFWQAGDKEGYIAYAQKHFKTASGTRVPRPVASRWYNLKNVLLETADDLWIHRQRNELWWTRSSSDAPQTKVIDDPRLSSGNSTGKVLLFYKKCTGWSNKDSKGRTLRWEALHPRAKDFLFTEGTFQSISPENAAYAETLIKGEDLSLWHNQIDWKAKLKKSTRGPVSFADARKKTIYRMAAAAFEAARQSGSLSATIRKNKEVHFPTQLSLENHIDTLMVEQEGLCALTGLELQFDDGDDDELRYSLDRINSDGHYEAGNLQLVCKFANAWKGAMPDEKFRRLLQLIRLSGDAIGQPQVHGT
jgi:hypothetical protein